MLLLVQKWSIMWRSIIASSLGATAFPYCRYIRILDLRDLSYLLDDDKFDKFKQGDISKSVALTFHFFARLDVSHLAQPSTHIDAMMALLITTTQELFLRCYGRVQDHDPASTFQDNRKEAPTSFGHQRNCGSHWGW